jgi:hypothetical protein
MYRGSKQRKSIYNQEKEELQINHFLLVLVFMESLFV